MNEKTYASATKSNVAVLIKPKNTEQNNMFTKSEILQNINPVTSQLNFSDIKNAKSGLLIGCENSEDLTKFKQMATDKLSEKYEIRDIGNFNPKIRVVGMNEKYSEDDLVNYVKFQNKYLVSDKFQCKMIEIKPLKKRADIFQAVLQIDVQSYNKIMSAGKGKLFVAYDICDVYDVINVKRCFNCSGFSHFSNQCRDQHPCCPRCAEHHTVKDCKADLLKCINCIRSNNTKKTTLNISHAAWDSACPCYISKVNEFKSSLILSK